MRRQWVAVSFTFGYRNNSTRSSDYVRHQKGTDEGISSQGTPSRGGYEQVLGRDYHHETV